ncbi:MAG: HEAT repeat domain-containing protein [Myxococcota bacterium]
MTGNIVERTGDETDIAEASEAFRLLLKGIKNLHIYQHAKARYQEFLQPAFQALDAFLSKYDSLPLKLEPFCLKLHDQPIYEDQDRENLTYKFYRDGVRFLVFRAGLTQEELLRFVLLAKERLPEEAAFQEDMVTRLWKEEFESIEYIVVEGFGFGELSENEVEIEVQKIVSFLRERLAATTDDVARFARLHVEDLTLELDNLEQVRGGIISGRTAQEADKARAQDEILHEQKERVFPKVVFILFQILEHECAEEDFDTLSDAFTQVLDALLLSEDIRGVGNLLERFRQLAGKDLPVETREQVSRIGDLIKSRMVDVQRLDALGRYMKLSKEFDHDAVRNYLSVCGPDELEPLLEMLEGLERVEARKILVEVLAEIGKDHVAVVGARLGKRSSNVVKDLLEILKRINPKDYVDLVAITLSNENIMVRLQGLRLLAQTRDERALRFIERACRDSELQIRMGAYRALAQRAPIRSADFFIRLVQEDGFDGRDQREKMTLFAALGETRTEPALKFLRGVFERKAGFFQKGRQNELKGLAIQGLSAMGTVGAFKVLAREVQNRSNSKEIMVAAQKAALRLKAQLEGREPEEASS